MHSFLGRFDYGRSTMRWIACCDPKTNTVLYSRGFSTIFGEWRSTEEAQHVHRAFQESLRFPKPAKPVRVRVLSRDDHNLFSVVWAIDVNADAPEVERKVAPAPAPPIAIRRSGRREEIRSGCAPARRSPVHAESIQGARERFQCVGSDGADRGVGHLAAFDGDPPLFIAWHALRHFRERALCAHAG